MAFLKILRVIILSAIFSAFSYASEENSSKQIKQDDPSRNYTCVYSSTDSSDINTSFSMSLNSNTVVGTTMPPRSVIIKTMVIKYNANKSYNEFSGNILESNTRISAMTAGNKPIAISEIRATPAFIYLYLEKNGDSLSGEIELFNMDTNLLGPVKTVHCHASKN